MSTTKVIEFLSDLRNLNIRLDVEGEKLHIRAPEGVLSMELKEKISAERDNILDFLRNTTLDNEIPLILPKPEDKYEPFPLTDVQQGSWIGRTSNFDLGNVAMHLYVEFEDEGMDPVRLEKAWQKLIDRHDMLRVIIRHDGQQQILEEVPQYKIEVENLRSLEPNDLNNRLDEIRHALSHQVLPTDKWPLFELRTTLLDNNKVRLHISIDLIIADGRSCQILMSEFAKCYNDSDVNLKPIEISFRDCVLAEQKLQESSLYQKSLDYWINRATQLPASPKLPLKIDPRTLNKPEFIRRKGRLKPEDWQNIKMYASQSGLTLSAVMLAAFTQVLAVWSKSNSFTVNLTLFNRLPMHEQINDIIGDFSSLIFLAVENAGYGTFEEQARRLQERLWEDMDYRYVSGVRVMREMTKMRGAGTDTMTVVFTSQLDNDDVKLFTGQSEEVDTEENFQAVEVIGLGKEVYGVSQTPQVWIDNQVAERGGALFFNWDCVDELFPDDLLDDMFMSYNNLLKNLAQSTAIWKQNTNELVRIPDYHMELYKQTKAVEKPMDDECIHRLFAKQALCNPNHIAVISGSDKISYGKLYDKANRIGWWLKERDAEPNQLVAVVMNKGWEQIAAVMGVLNSGAAYLPISAELPQQRIDYLLENGEVNLVITHSEIDQKIVWASNLQRLVIDQDDLSSISCEGHEAIQKPEDLAYVIYTSGSTGLPKGVMIDHRGVANTILDMNERFDISEEDRILAISALNFDLSVYDIFGILAAGATIVMPEPQLIKEPAHWLHLIQEEKVTIWNSVPAFMEMLVNYTEVHTGKLPQHLRLCLLSGDWIPTRLPDRIKSLNNMEIISLGGATEASIWSIIYPIQEVNPEWKSIPYGKPMVNQTFYVMDEALELRPLWVAGKLYIGGSGLAKGYWKDEEKTQASFITHPHTKERLYCTGDMGCYLPDGNIEFLGREDLQVKVRGHRIELGEIETAIMKYPQVDKGVAVLLDEENGAKRLVAYVMPTADCSLDVDQITEFLYKELPEYMVPSTLRVLTELPMTPNGKINRHALTSQQYVQQKEQTTWVEPRNEIEEVLASILSTELNIDEVGIYDNFFDLGGDSIVAAQMLAQIYTKFDVELPIQLFFENPTIADLAQKITINAENPVEEEHTQDKLPTIIPNKEDLYEPFPLTGLQQAYLVGRSDAVALGNVACHTYQEVDIKRFDMDRFDHVWQRMIARHDVLRTIILADGRQQVVENIPPYDIHISDLREESSEKIENELDELREYMSHQIIDIYKWPLFDIRATMIDDMTTRLHISVDALIADAWSVGLISEDICKLYEDLDAELPSLEITFRDYIVGMEELKETELYKRSLDYWYDRVDTLPPAPDLPLAVNYSSIKEPKFVRREEQLSEEMWNKLKEKSNKAGITPATVMMAAFADVLTMWSKTPKFTLNIPHFNRLSLHPDVNNLVGEFASFYLLEVDNFGKDGFVDRAKRIQSQLWQDMNNRYVSGVEILREMARQQSESPTVAMPIVYTSTIGLIETISSDRYSEEDSPLAILGDVVYSISQTPQVWLDCQVGERNGTLYFNWDAIEELFPEGLLDDMFSSYSNLLQDLANSDEVWEDGLSRLLPQWQIKQRAEINATHTHIPNELLHAMFATNAQRTPDNVAVIASERALTYKELYCYSNQLGRLLRSKDVEPNKLVAIVMEKGWEQIIAILGILQSGAAFLPIDAEQPDERISYMLRDGCVDIVLTQSHLNSFITWPDDTEIIILDGMECIEEFSNEPLTFKQTPDDLAYVMYTSGSTGHPKGVMISHRNVANVVSNTNNAFNIDSSDRIINVTAAHHDLSMYDIFGAFSTGGTLVVPDEALRLNPGYLLRLLDEEQVTVWNTVPAIMEMLVTHAEEKSVDISHALRLIILGGDWIPITLPQRIRELNKDVEILSIGGPTETTIWNIWYPVKEVNPDWSSIPYGKPTANSKYFIFNHVMGECPVWVPGELYCAGTQLAKGYWHDEAKTNASFVTHPITNERLYKTGDIGRYLPDGNIEFLGRADFQVKIRGQRIELGEIESVLAKHPQVRSAASRVIGELNKDKHLAAYVVLNQDDKEMIEDQRKVFIESLPEGVISDPLERMEFKRQHLGIREIEKSYQEVALSHIDMNDEFLQAYIDRRSHRNFLQDVIPLKDFSNWLSCLMQANMENLPYGKYQYASGGGLYPVQTYLYIKPGAIESLEGGAYYYNPVTHKLVLLQPFNEITDSPHVDNEQTFIDESAFSVFLIGQQHAIKPMYGEEFSDRFLYIESGIMAHLLETKSPELGIGLCQLGIVKKENIKEIFALDDGHMFLNCLIGGKVDESHNNYEALMNDWSAYQVTSLADDEQNDGVLIADELKDYLIDRLPSYMTPSSIVVLEEMPLTQNGKVNRRALPIPKEVKKEEMAKKKHKFTEPRTPLESMLVEIWSDVINVKGISVHDNFFELGGQSLLAMQVVSRIQQVVQVEVPIRMLFDTLTIANLAERLQDLMKSGQDLNAIPLQPISREEDLQLSFAQQRLWFLDQLEPGNPAYNVVAATKICGDINPESFEMALNEIIKRHETFRTIFAAKDGRPVQIVMPELTVSLPVIDYSSLSEEEQNAEIQRVAYEEAHKSFDLAQGPLLRCQFLKLTEDAYVLCMVMHHIISDAWSVGVFIQELTSLAKAFETKQKIFLPDMEVQYADFAAWQRKWLQGQVLENQLTYWKGQLEGAKGILDLPTDRPRPITQSYEGRIHTFTLSEELVSQLKEFCHQEGVTLFMALLASYNILLYKYTNQEDIIVGSPIANRSRREIEGLIGFFVNMLAIRTDLSGELTFKELVKNVKDVTLSAYANQDLPFEVLVDALSLDRDLSRNPLFQTAFALQNLPGDARHYEFPDITIAPIDIDRQLAQFEITLTMMEINGELRGTLEYNTALFDHSTICRFAEHMRLLLETITSNPSRPLCDIPLLTEEEKDLMLVEWNNTQEDIEEVKCIHAYFEEAVNQYPDNVAVVFEDRTMTYKELNHLANRTAHELIKEGVGAETIVAVYVERSIEVIISILGILKAGGCYMLLEPTYPMARLKLMVEDSQTDMLLVDSSLKDQVPAFYKGKKLCIHDDDEFGLEAMSRNPEVQIEPHNLAYIIYTSGSTGKPKGVGIEQHSLCNLVQAQIKDFNIHPDSHVLQFASLSFDASVSEIFTTLTSGAVLYMSKREDIMPGPELMEYIKKHEISVVTLPPSALSVIHDEGLDCLETVISAGEACSASLMRHWSKKHRFINAYGPTEGTVCSTMTMGSDQQLITTIGKPISNVQIYILDKFLNPVPIGVIGEIYIGGYGVARGYINRPQLTSERFIPNTLNDKHGDRLYKTGDLACYLPDGSIKFVGRTDSQVKLNGYRIETGEIECSLAEHANVQDVVVIKYSTDNKDLFSAEVGMLIAYVTLSEEGVVDEDELRSYLDKRLPEYMVPSVFILLEDMPLTMNGKVDRQALPNPNEKRLKGYVAPSSDTEKMIEEIWIEILGVEDVGVNDNFFEFGGHSLLATQVISRICDTFQVSLPLRCIFDAPTISGLAQLIDQDAYSEVASIKEDMEGEEGAI